MYGEGRKRDDVCYMGLCVCANIGCVYVGRRMMVCAFGKRLFASARLLTSTLYIHSRRCLSLT